MKEKYRARAIVVLGSIGMATAALADTGGIEPDVDACQNVRQSLEHMIQVNLENQQLFQTMLEGQVALLTTAARIKDDELASIAGEGTDRLKAFVPVAPETILAGVTGLQELCPQLFEE